MENPRVIPRMNSRHVDNHRTLVKLMTVTAVGHRSYGFQDLEYYSVVDSVIDSAHDSEYLTNIVRRVSRSDRHSPDPDDGSACLQFR